MHGLCEPRASGTTAHFDICMLDATTGQFATLAMHRDGWDASGRERPGNAGHSTVCSEWQIAAGTIISSGWCLRWHFSLEAEGAAKLFLAFGFGHGPRLHAACGEGDLSRGRSAQPSTLSSFRQLPQHFFSRVKSSTCVGSGARQMDSQNPVQKLVANSFQEGNSETPHILVELKLGRLRIC